MLSEGQRSVLILGRTVGGEEASSSRQRHAERLAKAKICEAAEDIRALIDDPRFTATIKAQLAFLVEGSSVDLGPPDDWPDNLDDLENENFEADPVVATQ